MRNRIIAAIVFTLAILSCQQKPDTTATPINNSIEKRVDELLVKMTIDEKIGQLNQYTSRW